LNFSGEFLRVLPPGVFGEIHELIKASITPKNPGGKTLRNSPEKFKP
jgi:hypothetical protein